MVTAATVWCIAPVYHTYVAGGIGGIFWVYRWIVCGYFFLWSPSSSWRRDMVRRQRTMIWRRDVRIWGRRIWWFRRREQLRRVSRRLVLTYIYYNIYKCAFIFFVL